MFEAHPAFFYERGSGAAGNVARCFWSNLLPLWVNVGKTGTRPSRGSGLPAAAPPSPRSLPPQPPTKASGCPEGLQPLGRNLLLSSLRFSFFPFIWGKGWVGKASPAGEAVMSGVCQQWEAKPRKAERHPGTADASSSAHVTLDAFQSGRWCRGEGAGAAGRWAQGREGCTGGGRQLSCRGSCRGSRRAGAPTGAVAQRPAWAVFFLINFF